MSTAVVFKTTDGANRDFFWPDDTPPEPEVDGPAVPIDQGGVSIRDKCGFLFDEV